MGDFGCSIWPTSPDPFLDAFEDDPLVERRLLVAPFFVLEVSAFELPVAVFLLFLVTIVVSGYFSPLGIAPPPWNNWAILFSYDLIVSPDLLLNGLLQMLRRQWPALADIDLKYPERVSQGPNLSANLQEGCWHCDCAVV